MRNFILVFLMCAIGCANEPGPEPEPQVDQYPSPMSEQVRAHDRVEDGVAPGFTDVIEGVLPRPVDLFLPEKWVASDSVDLLIHFHGASYVVRDAVDQSDQPLAAVVVNLGSGSTVYGQPFQDVIQFVELLIQVRDRMEPRIGKIYLSSWSAGYGAVRAILNTHADEISGVLLLDGLHTDYIPDRVTLHEGGSINGALLEGFLAYANAAVSGDRRMVITHSEIFPGTYVSTTETADYLAANLALDRTPVLEWGPVGMQMISRSSAGHLSILGFAGNSAPDHVDHFHGMATFLDLMLSE
jgi:hypothetical protein